MTYRQHIHKLFMMLCCDGLPTAQAMQWGQRSFEIAFKISDYKRALPLKQN
jgi:hypothetical protein